MKITKKNIILLLALALLPLVISLVLYPSLPEMVPTHWGISGGPDRFTPKFPGAFFGGITSMIITPLLVFLPRIDPKRRNYDRFSSAYVSIIVIFNLFCVFLTALTLAAALDPKIEVDRLVLIGIALLFAAIGNFMPKFKQNFFCGIKTPWTLSNDEVWVKTHRLAGRMWFAGGLFFALLGIFLKGTSLFAVFFIVLFSITLVPTAYSYLLFQKIARGEKSPQEKEDA